MRYAIKVRKSDTKKWGFLTPRGGVTHLRIHAARWAAKDACEKLIADNAPDNPDWQFKVVDMSTGAGKTLKT
ncbi:MAG: hypothetical protein M9944_21840 [Rhizobiaceae bacterium]|nr:hypothetical protein [Rhizobiaceae bacterium]